MRRVPNLCQRQKHQPSYKVETIMCNHLKEKNQSIHKKKKTAWSSIFGDRNRTAPIATPWIYLIAIRCVTIIQKTNNTSAIQEKRQKGDQKVTKKKSAVFKNKSENGWLFWRTRSKGEVCSVSITNQKSKVESLFRDHTQCRLSRYGRWGCPLFVWRPSSCHLLQRCGRR